MLSLPTERTALFLPQITVFTGQHENSPPLGGICLAAVNKNTFRQKKTKQNKKKKNQASIYIVCIIGILNLVDSCKYHLLALWIAKLSLEGLKK